MRSVLNELGKKVDDKELEKLMSDLDNDGSGEIDFDEFLKVRKVVRSYVY